MVVVRQIVACTLTPKAKTRLCLPQVNDASQDLQPVFAAIDYNVACNMQRLQTAFQNNQVDMNHISGSRGASMADTWNVIDAVVAHVLGTEAAICRLQLMSGKILSQSLELLLHYH